MKKIVAVSVLVIVVIAIFAVIFANMNNSYTMGVKQLIYLIENNEGAKATELFLYSFKEKDYESLIKLIDKENEKIPPLYIMLVSDYIYTKNKDKAIENFYIGRLRAKEDVFMCKDTTARQQLYLYSNAAPETVRYAEQRIFIQNDKEFLAKVLKKALDWDKSHPKRHDPTWACYHGIDSFYKSGKPELVSEQERGKIILNERANVMDAIKELKTSNRNLSN